MMSASSPCDYTGAALVDQLMAGLFEYTINTEELSLSRSKTAATWQ